MSDEFDFFLKLFKQFSLSIERERERERQREKEKEIERERCIHRRVLHQENVRMAPCTCHTAGCEGM